MQRQLVHALYFGAVLFAVWLLLSGHYTPFILILGLASCVAVIAITQRMEVIDHEGHPVHLTWRALLYWPWLIVEIVKANIDVAKRILFPSIGISPTMIRVKTSQTSDLGKVIYANSITLTPGTISVEVANDEILVHALSKGGAEDLLTGKMDRRVTRMVGEDR
tara:strand:+ start:465 stop:956 length:492 start_codon:yes stop_codon:yes gene_type:complete